MNVEKEEGLEG